MGKGWKDFEVFGEFFLFAFYEIEKFWRFLRKSNWGMKREIKKIEGKRLWRKELKENRLYIVDWGEKCFMENEMRENRTYREGKLKGNKVYLEGKLRRNRYNGERK